MSASNSHPPTNVPGATPLSHATHLRPRVVDEVAMPAGMFPGSSKLTFDVIYQAEQEATGREGRLQLTRSQLLSMTGLRNVKTLGNHLRYFSAIGVLTVTRSGDGNHKGNYYETHCERFRQAIAEKGTRRLQLQHYTRRPRHQADAPPQEPNTHLFPNREQG